MEIDLTSEQADFVRRAQTAGRVSGSHEALQQALGLWVDRERRRSELVADLDDAEATLARGEGIDFTQRSAAAIVEDVMRRSRHRCTLIAAGGNRPRLLLTLHGEARRKRVSNHDGFRR